jgi:hypothetical protein
MLVRRLGLVTLLSIVSQVGIALNLLKIWFLLMDRQTKEYLSGAR